MNYRFAVLTALLAWGAAAPAQEPPELKGLLAEVARYEYGQSREPLSRLSEYVRKALASPAETQAVEAALDRFLGSEATRDGKEAVCRELSVMGSERSVPALGQLLAQEQTAEMARYALERIGGEKADAAVRGALAQASGRRKIGLVNTLGRRCDRQAVPVLRALLNDSDAALSAAAADALARIADSGSRAALEDALAKSAGMRRAALADALLVSADQLLAEKDPAAALAIYEKLYRPAETETVQVAALRGIAAAAGEAATPALSAALLGPSARLRAAASQILGGMPGAGAAKALLGGLKQAPWQTQVQVLAALAERGEVSPDVFTAMLSSPEPDVRVAALEGLVQAGGADAVMPLGKIAAGATDQEQTAARQSLYRLRGPEVDRVLAGSIGGAEPKVRVELIRAAGERGTREAAGALLAAAKDDNAEVRREALRALRDTAAPERLPALIGLLLNARDSADRRESQRALLAVVKRSPGSRGPELASAYRAAGGMEARNALLELMAQAGSEDTLPLFRGVLQGGDDQARRGAIVALSQWPTAAPAALLLKAAEQEASPALRILSLRGYIRLVALPAGRPPAETATMLGAALAIARQPEEKRSILAVLQKTPSPESLRLAESVLNDPAVAQEALLAVNALKRALGRR
jgi:HEAT repeat protein